MDARALRGYSPAIVLQALISGLILSALLSGCCAVAPPAPDMLRLPGHTLGSPQATIEYFRAALADPSEQAVRHQYLCFSDALKDQVRQRHGQAFTLEAYMQVRDDVRDYIRKRLGGDATDAEVGSIRMVHPELAEAALILGSGTVTLQLVLETTFSIWWTDPALGRTDGTLPFGVDPATLSPSALLLRLPLPAQTDSAERSIYRVSYERAWRILGLTGSDLAADMERFVRERAPKQ